MDGVVIGRSPTSNALLVYNPRNKQYYEPDSYRLDPYRLPGLAYPSIKYNGGLFCSLLCNNNPHFEEYYPPGTPVERIDPVINMLVSGTVMDIPFPVNVSDSLEDKTDLPYTILFDDGKTAPIPLSEMASLIPPPPITPMTKDGANSLLPPFLHLSSLITFKHEGQYHKGYLGQLNGIYWFSYKSHVNKRQEDWGVPLPNLPSTWVDLCIEGILIPGHVSHSFFWSPSSSTPTTFNLVASFVSAVNLNWDCPPSLLKALADTHPNREIWLESFFEEKHGIQNLDMYEKITLGKYRALRKKGLLRLSPPCVSSLSRRMRTSAHFVPSLTSLFVRTMKTAFGRRATNFPLSSIRILSVSSQAWRSRLAVPFIRVIVKTHSVRASFLFTRLLLFAPLARSQSHP